MARTLNEIVAHLKQSLPTYDIVLHGDGNLILQNLRSLKDAQPGDISFLVNESYQENVALTQASALLLGKNVSLNLQIPMISMQNPYLGLAILTEYFYPIQHPWQGIHPTAVLEPGVILGKNVGIAPYVYVGRGCHLGDQVTLYPHVVLGEGVRIGQKTTLYSHVSVYASCQIGSFCTLHSGAVIGADGFGFATDFKTGKHRKINQLGKVIIQDHVEIGANCAIDRGAMEPTLIGEGTKMDNLIQIGHGVKIGQDCLLVSQCGIAGSTVVGNHVLIGGQVGIAGKLGGSPIRIANGVQIAAQTGVDKSLENPDYPKPKGYWGFPQAMPIREAERAYVHIKKIPDYLERIKALEKTVAELQQKMNPPVS
ncbi:MAG: UDP-3-O-(3-hydroxymyristoyl)glucosamine N-acyltransferase [Planctomycetota bacterium]